jgi:outer membrane lipoprotein-sorting protein
MRTRTGVAVRITCVVLKYFALAFAASAPMLAQTPAAGLDDAFARTDKLAQQLKAVTADMNRDVFTSVINDHEKDTGTIKFKRDKAHDTRMLIQFTGADPKTVALDGASVSVYLPKSKVEQVYDVKKGLVEQFLLLGFGATSTELKSAYDITFLGVENIGSDSTWHLQLIPKSPDVLKSLKKAELWLSQTTGLPAQQKLVLSSSGDYYLVTYSNMKLNPTLPDNDLKLNPPKGVTVEHPRL